MNNFNGDIVSGVVAYLMRQSLLEQEKQDNAELLIAFYSSIGKLADLCDFSSERNMILLLVSPSTYSPYLSLFNATVSRSLHDFFIELQQQLNKKISKLKGIDVC